MKTVASQGPKGPSPISASQLSACGKYTSAKSHNKTRLTRTVLSASSSQLDSDVDRRISGDSDVELDSFKAVDPASSISNEDMDNALLQGRTSGYHITVESAVSLVDFKEHLAGISDKGTYVKGTLCSAPSRASEAIPRVS